MDLYMVIMLPAIFLAVVLFAVLASSKRGGAPRAGDTWPVAARRLKVGYFRPRRIEGVLPTGHIIVEAYLRGSGRSTATWTRYQARHHRSLGLGVHLNPFDPRLLSPERRRPPRDILTGDPAFDGRVSVRGNDRDEVLELLTPDRRRLILECLDAFPGLTVDEGEVRWEERGLQEDCGRIVNTIDRLSRLSSSLSGVREEVAADTRTREGAGSIPVPAPSLPPMPPAVAPPPGPPPAAERPLVAEVGTPFPRGGTEDRAGETATAGAIGTARGPTEGERQAVIEEILRAEGPQREPGVPPATAARPAASPAVEVPSPDLDAARVCDALFGPGIGPVEAGRTFDERHRGRRVRWRGVLRSVEDYFYDFAFEGGPGTKAVLEVHEVPDTFGPTKVHAAVGLPPGQRGALEPRIGEPLIVEGRLRSFDHLLRQVHIEAGDLREPRP